MFHKAYPVKHLQQHLRLLRIPYQGVNIRVIKLGLLERSPQSASEFIWVLIRAKAIKPSGEGGNITIR